MGNRSEDGQKAKRKSKGVFKPLPPEVEARMTRRVTVLLGLIPLAEMTQDETDWLFHQKLRTAGDD
jgi:hypothetical protein